MSATERVLGPLDRVRRSGTAWEARCPAHEDRHPSLRVEAGDEGRVLLHCQRGCPTADVLAALGLAWRDLFDGAPGPPPPRSHESSTQRWAATWEQLRRRADERTETYLRGDEPTLPRARRPAPAPVPPGEEDYVGPGGERRKRLPPLRSSDFADAAAFAAYERWRLGDGRLPPRRPA